MADMRKGRYNYVGQGAGVVGLPHSLLVEELEPWQVELFDEAIKNGNYAPEFLVSANPKPKRGAKSAEGETNEHA